MGALLLQRTNSCGHLEAGCRRTVTVAGMGLGAHPRVPRPFSQFPHLGLCIRLEKQESCSQALEEVAGSQHAAGRGAFISLMLSVATGPLTELPTGESPP